MTAPYVVILAGGSSRRMGGQDKALQLLHGQPLIQHVIDRVEPQAGSVAVNTSATDPAFVGLGLPLLPDVIADRPGPLAGVLTAMRWAKDQPFVITVPADAPFLPGDLIPRLMLASPDPHHIPAIATSNDRIHPVCGLWPTGLADDLERALANGTRKVRDWTDQTGAKFAPFAATDPDGFFNVNTPDDLARAAQYLEPSQ